MFGRDTVMFKALKGMFARADAPIAEDERDAAGKPMVTLAGALKHGWLDVWYQPKVSLQTHHWVGAEALIRLRHPELGILGPGAFLPGASEADMLTLTETVIATALRDWNDCAALGMPELHLAVNVPASAFVEIPIARIIREERPKSDKWPGLILEVTEDQIVNDLKMANEVANELRQQNCSLAIDDFGAGYSSLGRLRQLPFSELKIDRAYVMDCHLDKMKGGHARIHHRAGAPVRPQDRGGRNRELAREPQAPGPGGRGRSGLPVRQADVEGGSADQDLRHHRQAAGGAAPFLGAGRRRPDAPGRLSFFRPSPPRIRTRTVGIAGASGRDHNPLRQ